MRICEWKKSICSIWRLSILRSLPLVHTLVYMPDGYYLFICTYNKINIHFLIFSPFCHFLPHPFVSVSSLRLFPSHSGAKSVCICRLHRSAGRREWVAGSHLHSRAWPPRRQGVLGYGAGREKWEAHTGRGQRHYHSTCALHVAAAELRTGEEAQLCGAAPGPADRVQHTLHTKCSLWVLNHILSVFSYTL